MPFKAYQLNIINNIIVILIFFNCLDASIRQDFGENDP